MLYLESAEKHLKEFTSGGQIKSFFLWNIYFSEVFHNRGGFDVVIVNPPEALIHVDIESEVFNRNFPAKLAIQGDSRQFVEGLSKLIEGQKPWADVAMNIAEGHAGVVDRWESRASKDGVTPHRLFSTLQKQCRADAIFTTDSGNGTFLAMEHLRLDAPGRFLAPTDFSCMGYSVPAAIGACFAHPGRDVVALPGDGAFLMTGLELITASAHGATPLVCVLRDGPL